MNSNNETSQPPVIETPIAEINQDSPDCLLINMAKGDLDPGDIHALLLQLIEDKHEYEKDKKKTIVIDPHSRNITDQNPDDGYKDNTITKEDTHTNIKTDMHIHTIMNSNNKFYQLFVNIFKFIMGLAVIFYPTTKRVNQNNMIHIYPHHSH